VANLSEAQKEEIRFHLAVTDAVADGDQIIFNDRIGQPLSEARLRRIRETLEACDRSYGSLLELTTTRKQQLVTGDVIRNITDFEAERTTARKRYVAQCDLLAEALGVPNWRNPDSPFFWRIGESGVISRISKHDGTSVPGRIAAYAGL
jgi:hypothetical protein